MKTLILLLLTSHLTGCCCWGLYTRYDQAEECFSSQREAYCIDALTEEQKLECMTELQDRCVHESLTGQLD